MSKTGNVSRNIEQHDASDLVWGAEAIGREINRTASQVHYLQRTGALAGCAVKIGHKTLVGSRRRLADLPFQTTASAK